MWRRRIHSAGTGPAVISTPGLRNQVGVLLLLSTIGALQAHATVEFEGQYSFAVDGNDVTLEVERLVNRSSTRTTGTLYLTLWMTTGSDPYTTGHTAARVSLGTTLRPGYMLEDVSRTTDYSRPEPRSSCWLRLHQRPVSVKRRRWYRP